MATAYGVEYDLRKSKYKVTVNAFTFYFSSQAHMRNFQKRLPVKVNWLCDSLSRRFKYRVEASEWAVFRNYTEIETRGFLVEVDGELYDSPDFFHFASSVVLYQPDLIG